MFLFFNTWLYILNAKICFKCSGAIFSLSAYSQKSVGDEVGILRLRDFLIQTVMKRFINVSLNDSEKMMWQILIGLCDIKRNINSDKVLT